MKVRFLAAVGCLLCLGVVTLQAQTPGDQDAVIEVIRQLFTGMEKGDSVMVKASFAEEVTMATISRSKENNERLVRESSLEGFLKAVGTRHPEIWYEEIWNIKVQIDGGFAQVWCDYAFYVGNKFNHCGVDAFHLYRERNGWKIFHLSDTRRSNNCNIPNEIQRKYAQ